MLIDVSIWNKDVIQGYVGWHQHHGYDDGLWNFLMIDMFGQISLTTYCQCLFVVTTIRQGLDQMNELASIGKETTEIGQEWRLIYFFKEKLIEVS